MSDIFDLDEALANKTQAMVDWIERNLGIHRDTIQKILLAGSVQGAFNGGPFFSGGALVVPMHEHILKRDSKRDTGSKLLAPGRENSRVLIGLIYNSFSSVIVSSVHLSGALPKLIAALEQEGAFSPAVIAFLLQFLSFAISAACSTLYPYIRDCDTSDPDGFASKMRGKLEELLAPDLGLQPIPIRS